MVRNGRNDMPIVIVGIAAAVGVIVILAVVLFDGRLHDFVASLVGH
jgi:hypothetical protein